MRNAMPDRDASWGRRTYYAFGNEGPLDRLIRRATTVRHAVHNRSLPTTSFGSREP
jgi:hypothetical protein